MGEASQIPENSTVEPLLLNREIRKTYGVLHNNKHVVRRNVAVERQGWR